MSFKPIKNHFYIRSQSLFLYLADVVGDFKIEMPRCKSNVRLSFYFRLAGLQDSLVVVFYLDFEVGIFL